jgi:hypothetical protein
MKLRRIKEFIAWPAENAEKKNLINLRDLCALSGETLRKNGIEFNEV